MSPRRTYEELRFLADAEYFIYEWLYENDRYEGWTCEEQVKQMNLDKYQGWTWTVKTGSGRLSDMRKLEKLRKRDGLEDLEQPFIVGVKRACGVTTNTAFANRVNKTVTKAVEKYHEPDPVYVSPFKGLIRK